MRRVVWSSLVLAGCLAQGAPAWAAGSGKECAAAAEKGQRLREKREMTEARDAFITCSKETCPAAVKVECSAWLADVQQRMPSIVGRATDGSGKDIVDASMYIDGKLAQDRLDGRRVELDPGQHTLKFVHVGSKPFETSIVAREGERNRLVDAVLPPVDAVAKPAEPPPREAPGEPPPRKERPFPVLPAVLAGVGVAGGVLFAVFASSGSSELDDLRGSCAPNCSQDDVDAARTKITIANVSLGVGVLALGAAAVLLLLPSSGSAKVSRPRPGVGTFALSF